MPSVGAAFGLLALIMVLAIGVTQVIPLMFDVNSVAPAQIQSLTRIFPIVIMTLVIAAVAALALAFSKIL